MARLVGAGRVWHVKERPGEARQARQVLERYGEARRGRPGEVRHCTVRLGRSRQAWSTSERGERMAARWKVPGLFPVSADEAYAEIVRIGEKNGCVRPGDIVEESRDESAPLHECFEWDDTEAARMYRERQAGDMLRGITVEVVTEKREPVEVRAFVSTGKAYRGVTEVLKSDEQTSYLLERALAELESFRRKYRTLSELAPVFRAIEEVRS